MLTDRLHVAVLCSKRAPGLDGLLRHPLRGTLYDLDCVVSTESPFDDCELPVIPHPEWMIRSSWADLVVDALIATRKDVALSKVFV